VDAAVATPLAVVLNELIQNAIEHGLGDGQGTITVELRGGDDQPVVLEVHDDGPGPGTPEPHPRGVGAPEATEGTREPPPPVSGAPEREGNRPGNEAREAVHSPRVGLSPGGGLGLRLIRALVEEELNGRFTLSHPPGRGSIATAVIPPVERAG
jgi:two-component sensor histidine kinase